MIMSLQQLTSIEDVRQFLEGTEAATFSILASKQERYQWILFWSNLHGHDNYGYCTGHRRGCANRCECW